MKAVILHETGGPEVLKIEDIAVPVPKEGEVLVQIEAIGVNRYDVNQRAGAATTFPVHLGSEASGRRVDTGQRVLVVGHPTKACYAEFAAIPEEFIWPIPDSLDAVMAAAVGVPYKTAWWCLVDQAGLQAGETLLVQAGASASGQACVDLGVTLGATVFATARPEKHERLREYGAEPLDYGDPRIEQLGADVVYEPVGTDTFRGSMAALAPGGRMVVPGALGGADVSFNIWDLVLKRIRIIGFMSPAPRELLERVIDMAANGKIRPAAGHVFPLEEVAAAHRLMESREAFGRIILTP